MREERGRRQEGKAGVLSRSNPALSRAPPHGEPDWKSTVDLFLEGKL